MPRLFLSRNVEDGNTWAGVEESLGVLIDAADNQYTLMRPHDVTVPHQDMGLIEELLTVLVRDIPPALPTPPPTNG
jgi:hypothetical protein